MQKCKYVFTNNSKNHQKGEVCGAVIRKTDNGVYCWQYQHAQSKEMEINHFKNIENEKFDFI
jgi:hypothetical protein